MSNWNLFDHYSFRARLCPALIALAPLALGILAWTGATRPWMSCLWTLCSTAGVTYFFAVVVRSRGKVIEQTLWKSWGGCPTTQLLRHSGPGNPALRERAHKVLAKLLGRALPTASEEAAAPAEADGIYEAGVRLLIGKTRDTKKFPLLYKENVSYGFSRNLYAIRWVGRFFAVVGLVACYLAEPQLMRAGNPSLLPMVCFLICAVIFACWLFAVNPDFVRVPAFAYAERLLEASEALSQSRSKKPKTQDQET